MTSDDDDGDGLPIRRRPNTFDAWSSDSLGSSLQNSVNSSSELPFPRPLASSFSHNSSHGRMTSAKQQAAQNETQKASAAKTKVSRQPYIGPCVDDADEPLSDEEDFERFRMEIRVRKIVEFHQAAAQADIQLAIAIYKDRKSLESDNQSLSSRVSDHQKRMSQLQMEKEEERKNIVKAERSKRRTELRRRPGRSNTLIAPIPSVPTNPSWLNSFQEQTSGDLESSFDLQKILADDANEREGSVEDFLQKMFPGTSSAGPVSANNTREPALHHPYSSAQPTWGLASTSTPALVSASQASKAPPSKRRPSDVSSSRKPEAPRPIRLVKPSLFGDDESSDEDDGSPPTAHQPLSSFEDARAGAAFSNHLMEDPDLVAALSQWGGLTEAHSVPPMPSWGTKPSTQISSTPSPWAAKDVGPTPVASGWNRRRPSISTPQPGPSSQSSFDSSFGLAGSSDGPLSLSALAAFNASQAKARASLESPLGKQQQVFQPVPPKKASPPLPTPPSGLRPTPPTVATKVDNSSPSTPAPAPAASAPKKMNKKQRLAAMKKGGASSNAAEEPEPEPEAPLSSPSEPPTPQGPTLAAATSAQDVEMSWSAPKMVPSMARVRKESNTSSPFPSWDDVASTPRPASKIPTNFQAAMAIKPEGTPRPNPLKKTQMGDIWGAGSQSSTIKATQWGSAATSAASRSAWNIFGEEQPSNGPQPPAAASRLGSRDPWIPGGFDIDDSGGGEGGGRGDGGEVVEEQQSKPPAPQLWSPAGRSQVDKAAVPPQPQQPTSAMPQRLRSATESRGSPATNVKANTPAIQTPVASTPANSKKAKGKKNGKGKKVTVEEVQDDEQDTRGESLPVDSRFIMEPQVILEPRPSVPPTMYESIISYDNEEEEGHTTSSSVAATPSTAPSSPPDPFDGDEIRRAKAIKELMEGTSRMEKVLGGGSWNTGGTKQHATWTPSGTDQETSSSSVFSAFGRKPLTSTPMWGQLNAKDKGKGKMSDLSGGNEIPKTSPTIQNLKRSKVAAGGKLF